MKTFVLLLISIPGLVLVPWRPVKPPSISERSQPPHEQEPHGPHPVSLVVLYDVTVSVTDEAIERDEPLKKLAGWVQAGLRPADSLAFGLVASRVYLSRMYAASEIVNVQDDLIRPLRVADTERFGTSPLSDALLAGMRMLTSTAARRAVLIVTDGRSTGNRTSFTDVVAEAKAADVSIWPVDYWPSEWTAVVPGERQRYAPDPWARMRDLARQTGGRDYRVPPMPPTSRGTISAQHVNSAFAVVGEGLRKHLSGIFDQLHR